MSATVHMINTIQPGESVQYFTGPYINAMTPEVIAARMAYNDGLVDLVQRKCDFGYRYIAIGRHKRARVPVWEQFGAAFLGVEDEA